MDESTLRTLLGTDLAEASDLDLRGTLGHPAAATSQGGEDTAAVDPEAPTLILGAGAPTDSVEEEDAEGLLLRDAGYELLEEVGRGGMNVVFRARQYGLEREVAVKRLRSRRRSSRSSRWSFLSEAVVTAQLDHPNVIPIYGMSVDESGDVALAMKLMRGRTWAHRLREDFADHRPEDAPPHLEQNLRILLGVIQAVSFAHSRGILHRDLKPENVMIGEFGEVQVVDWGLAVRFSDGDAGVRAPHRTSVRKTAGTPVYMAPEMVEARGDALGPWTDVYLLGGLLHEVLTGRPPHRGAKLIEVLLSAFDSSPPIFSAAVPAELQDACRRALARDPSERFATALELRRAIEDHLSHAESLQICQRAMTRLEHSRETVHHGLDVSNRAEVYADLRDVIAGFGAARAVWPENTVALDGEREARLLLARSALEMGELGTAESALRGEAGEETDALREQILEAIAARERTLRTTRRVSLVLLFSQIAIALALGLWGRSELRAYHHENEVAELNRLTPLVGLVIRGAGVTEENGLGPLVARIARDMASQGPLRITVTNAEGRVLADSEEDPASMPNHARRPEFAEAARAGVGVATRWSDTLGEEMVYHAMPIRDAAGQPALFVRLAVPLQFVTQQLQALVAAVSFSFLASVVMMCLLTVLLTRHLTRAIERIR